MAVSAGELTLFLSANTTSASRNLATVDKQVTELANRRPSIEITTNVAKITANVKRLNEQLDDTIGRTEALAKVTFKNVDDALTRSSDLLGVATGALVQGIKAVSTALNQLAQFSLQLFQLPQVFYRVYNDVIRLYGDLAGMPVIGEKINKGAEYLKKSLIAAFSVLAPEVATLGVYKELGATIVGAVRDGLNAAATTGKDILYLNLFNDVREGIGRTIDDLGRLGLAFRGLFDIAGTLQSIFGGAFNYLIGQNARLQETILSTQTVLASTTKVTSTEGEITDPLQKILALEGPVNTAIENIRRRSLKLAGVTSSQVIDIFQTVATNIGAIGGTIKDAEDLAISFTAGLGTLGIPLFQAQQEIGSILTGTINQDSLLAQRLGITNSDIQKARNATDGVVGYIQKKLKTAVAGQAILATTLSGVTSNFKELFELVGQAAGKPLLTPLLAGLNAVFNQLFRLKGLLLDTAEVFSTTLLDGFTTLFSELGGSALVEQTTEAYRKFSEQYAQRNQWEEEGKSVGNLIKQAMLTAHPEKVVSEQLLPLVKVFRELRNEVVLTAQSAAAPLAELFTIQRGLLENPMMGLQRIASFFVLDWEIFKQYDTFQSSVNELAAGMARLGVVIAKMKIREFGDTIRYAAVIIRQFGAALFGAMNLAASFFQIVSGILELPLVKYLHQVQIAAKLVRASDLVDNLKTLSLVHLGIRAILESDIKGTIGAFSSGFLGALKVAPAFAAGLGKVADQLDGVTGKLLKSSPALQQYEAAMKDVAKSTADTLNKQALVGEQAMATLTGLVGNQRIAALIGDVTGRVFDRVGTSLGYTAEQVKKLKEELMDVRSWGDILMRTSKGVIAQFLTIQFGFLALEFAIGAIVAAFSNLNEEMKRTERLEKAVLVAKTPGFMGNVDERVLQLKRQKELEREIAKERQEVAKRSLNIQENRSLMRSFERNDPNAIEADRISNDRERENRAYLKQLEAQAAWVKKQLEYRRLTVSEVLNLGKAEQENYVRALERGLSSQNANYDELVKKRGELEKYLAKLKEANVDGSKGTGFFDRKILLDFQYFDQLLMYPWRDAYTDTQAEVNKLKADEKTILDDIIERETYLNDVIEARRKKEQAIKTDKQGQDAKRDLAGIFTGAVEPTVAKIEEVVQKLQERLRSSSPTAPDYMEQVRAVELAKNLSQDAGKSVLDKFVEASQVQADAARKVKEAEIEAADIRRNSVKEAVQEQLAGINQESAELLSMADEKRERELDLQKQIRKSQMDIAEIQRKSWLNQVRQAEIIKAIMEGIELPGQKPVTDLGILAKTIASVITITPADYKALTNKTATMQDLKANPAMVEEYAMALISNPVYSGKTPLEVLTKLFADRILVPGNGYSQDSMVKSLYTFFKRGYADKYNTPYMTLEERKAAIRNRRSPIQIADQSSTLKQLAQVDPLRSLKLEGDTLGADQNAQEVLGTALRAALAQVNRAQTPGARKAQTILRELENQTQDTIGANRIKDEIAKAETPDERFAAAFEQLRYDAYQRTLDRYKTTTDQLLKARYELTLSNNPQDRELIKVLDGYLKTLSDARVRLMDAVFRSGADEQIKEALRNNTWTQAVEKTYDSLNEVGDTVKNYLAGVQGTADSIIETVKQQLKSLFPQGYSGTATSELHYIAQHAMTLAEVMKRTSTILSNLPQTIAATASSNAEIKAIQAGPLAYQQYKDRKPLLDALGGAEAYNTIIDTLKSLGKSEVTASQINELLKQEALTPKQAQILLDILNRTGKSALDLSSLMAKLAEAMDAAAKSSKQLQLAQNLANQDQQNAQSQVDIEAALGKLTPEQAAIRKMEIQAGAEMDPDTRARMEDALRLASVQERIKGILDQTRQGFQAFFNELGTGFAEAIVDGKNFWESLQQAASNFFMSLGKYLFDLAAQQAAMGIMKLIGNLFSFSGAVGNSVAAFGPNSLIADASLGIAANGAVWQGGFTPFAAGGLVDQPTLGLVGEGRYNEAIVPLPDGRSIPVQLSGNDPFAQNRAAMGASAPFSRDTAVASLERSLAGNSTTINTTNGGVTVSGGAGGVNYSFQTTRVLGEDLVTTDQLVAATTRARQEGAAQGARLALEKLRQSPQTRRQVGI